jgi:hypothetical protein
MLAGGGQRRRAAARGDERAQDYNESGESARSFMRVAAFTFAFNLDWHVVR